MLISSVATAVDSATLVAGAQNWLVTQPAGEAPRRFFQNVLYLHFPTDAFTSGFVVDDAATVSTGSFGPHTYDGLHPDNPALAAKVTAAGVNLMVQLDGPRQVLAVAPKGSYSVELYRVDAGTVAAQPTETTSDGNGTIGGPAFTDATFAVVLKSGGTAKAAPAVNDLQSISLRGYPTGPRLGIADPKLQSIDFFWRANGQVGTTVPAAAGDLGAAGSALAKALTRYLDSAWQALKGAALPDRFEAALVIQSDEPCELNLNLQIAYHRLLAVGDKQFLRFAGDRVETQGVPLRLPGKPTIVSATLRAVESLQARNLPAAGGESPLSSTGIAARQGVRLTSADARCAAQSFTPAAAVSASGLSVGVLALSADTELTVEVRAGQSGAPASVALAQAKISVVAAGRPQWVMVSFAKPAVVPAEPHWIVLGAAKGAFVWLTEADAGSVLTGAWGAGLWNAAGSIDGARALYRIVSADHAAGVQPAPLIAPDAWRLSLESSVLTGTRDKDNGVVFDLAASLTVYMQTATPVNGVTTAPIQVTAMAKGGITVYAPRVVYDP
jgi:hypothetical protein